MEYFLVIGTVYRTYYMDEQTKFDDMRLVKAISVSEAERKYHEYWSGQTNEYSVYYSATGHAFPTIV